MESFLTTSEALKYATNATLNAKGANAWNSTLNSLVDLFVSGTKKCPTELEEFEKIFQIVQNAYSEDPNQFVKILKFHRLIKKGNGIKWLYYLCMIVLKLNVPNELEKYEQVLDWSWEYPKDLLSLCRLSNMYGPFPNSSGISIEWKFDSESRKKNSLGSKLYAWGRTNKQGQQVFLEYELVLYARQVYKLFVQLISPNPSEDSKPNPMFLKYMGYEGGHWALETKLIWVFVEQLISTDLEFAQLVKSTDMLESELGMQLREILKNSFCTNKSPSDELESNDNHNFSFTNKTRRQIKKCFNSHLNLLDNLFKGVHQDGRLFGWGVDETEEEEIILIANQLKRSATLAFNRFEKTVKTYSRIRSNRKNYRNELREEHEQSLTLTQQLLSKGYSKYLEMVASGKAKVKTTGLDVSEQVWEFFSSNEDFSQSVESKLTQMVDELKVSLKEIVSEELFSLLANKFEIVLDISGSMSGKPIQTGLLYMCLMAKVFSIKRLFYFESSFHQVDLSDEMILTGTMCDLVRKIYKKTNGSTELEHIFSHFRSIDLRDKNVIIITDGDCDPSNGSTNPFHTAPKGESGLKYVVVNVNETKMNFPFLGLDPDVCYVTGSNPKTINGLIKALVISGNNNVPITPTLVLNCSLDLEELEHDFIIPNHQIQFSREVISELFDIFMSNLPPQPLHETKFQDEFDAQRFMEQSGCDFNNGFDSDKNLSDDENSSPDKLDVNSPSNLCGSGGRL